MRAYFYVFKLTFTLKLKGFYNSSRVASRDNFIQSFLFGPLHRSQELSQDLHFLEL